MYYIILGVAKKSIINNVQFKSNIKKILVSKEIKQVIEDSIYSGVTTITIGVNAASALLLRPVLKTLRVGIKVGIMVSTLLLVYLNNYKQLTDLSKMYVKIKESYEKVIQFYSMLEETYNRIKDIGDSINRITEKIGGKKKRTKRRKIRKNKTKKKKRRRVKRKLLLN